jgi:hypothetical protein
MYVCMYVYIYRYVYTLPKLQNNAIVNKIVTGKKQTNGKRDEKPFTLRAMLWLSSSLPFPAVSISDMFPCIFRIQWCAFRVFCWPSCVFVRWSPCRTCTTMSNARSTHMWGCNCPCLPERTGRWEKILGLQKVFKFLIPVNWFAESKHKSGAQTYALLCRLLVIDATIQIMSLPIINKPLSLWARVCSQSSPTLKAFQTWLQSPSPECSPQACLQKLVLHELNVIGFRTG